MKIIAMCVLAIGLSGCAGVGYVMDNYASVTPTSVMMKDDRYRVFEHPSENKVMVTPSFGAAAGGGMVSGLTLGSTDISGPKPLFQRAVRHYLDETGRKTCAITDGYIVLTPQWEFTFTCTPAHGAKEPFTPYVQPDVEHAVQPFQPGNVPR